MVSKKGLVSTYGMSMTTAISPSETQSAHGDISIGTPTNSKADSVQTTRIVHSAAAFSSTSPAAVETAVSPASTSAGLSTGAKAGIAVGAILGICALIAVIFFFLRLKRRMVRVESMVKLGSTASVGGVTPMEKPVLPAPALATPFAAEAFAPVASGGRADPGVGQSHRNTEDWRRFFGNGNHPRPQTAT